MIKPRVFLLSIRAQLIAGIAVLCALQGALAADAQWVGTWGCGPQLTEPKNLPPAPLADSTLRQFVRVTIGGKHLRVRFSNAFGTDPVVVNSAHVALAGTLGTGEINTNTDRALLFHGTESVSIPAGETIYSDPLDYELPAQTNLAVTIYFGAMSSTTICGHPGSRTTSFILASNVVTAATMPSAAKTEHWYIITGVDVMADSSSKALVILGDSITDGRGSTTDRNNRWPDNLARRLSTNAATAGVGVLNMGIGGNGIFGGLGPAARARFDWDVLNQSGARWVIVFEGVNDIGGAWGTRGASIGTNLINAYQEFVTKAHAHNLLIYGATITSLGRGYYSAGHEEARQTVNNWIRTNNLFDAVIDFDAAVRNPANPTNLLSAYNSGDGLHLNPAGYQAMANAIPLKLFTP
jgi:lysophospholipase L1-like esterase